MKFRETLRALLFGRANAYRRTFSGDNDSNVVLVDLARFCRAHTSTGHADANVAARLDGRREVWLRIQHHLNLPDEMLWEIYSGGQHATKE